MLKATRSFVDVDGSEFTAELSRVVLDHPAVARHPDWFAPATDGPGSRSARAAAVRERGRRASEPPNPPRRPRRVFIRRA
jgi:hypothetical protein